MKHQLPELIAQLRLLVGYLGEKNLNEWWGSNFLSSTSSPFLAPVFPRTTMLAKYHGVCEAALLIHDEHIGIGSNFHLYRLPDSIEILVAKSLDNPEFQQQIADALSSREVAQKRLDELTTADGNSADGPVVLGAYSESGLNQILHNAASHYSRAFKDGYKCFPYMKEEG